MTPQELKFIAVQEFVEVEPLTNIDEINLIQLYIPPSTPLNILKMPFYVAKILKNSNLVRIRLPHYLSFEVLKTRLDEEVANENEYSLIHKHLFVLGKDIIRNSYNVTEEEDLFTLIDKLKDVRFKKTLMGISKIDGRALNLNNMTSFEYYEIKKLLVEGMLQRNKLENTKNII